MNLILTLTIRYYLLLKENYRPFDWINGGYQNKMRKKHILISGTGSNLKNLINHSFKKNSKFKIVLVVSNNSKAKGLIYAKKFKIKNKINTAYS